MKSGTLSQFFDVQILTAQKARKMYQDGADERTGMQRKAYLAYAEDQANRETLLREVYVALLSAIDDEDEPSHDENCGCSNCQQVREDAEERVENIRQALQAIIDIGKRDLRNAKYDGYFESARKALE
jgi:hypothetical protein